MKKIYVSKLCQDAYIEMIQKVFGDQCVMWQTLDSEEGLVLPDIKILLVVKKDK